MIRIILTALFIASCGDINVYDPKVNVDTKPAKAAESEEEEETESEAPKMAEATEEEEAPAKVYTKVTKGMSREDALKLLGQPDTVASYSTRVEWIYEEADGEEVVCADRYDIIEETCYLTFDAKSDTLKSQYGIDTDLLDLMSF